MSIQQRTDYTTILAYLTRLNIPVYDFVSHLSKGYEVGEGAAMRVYQGVLTRPGEEPFDVALKEPRFKAKMREAEIVTLLNDFRLELRMMKHFESHPYVINLYGVAFVGLSPVIVVELAKDRLSHHLENCKEKGNRVDWQTKARFCAEIADGLHALHLSDIVHGDIKGDNILLFPDRVDKNKETLIAKISDFGFSSTMTSSHKSGGIGGTRAFWAPERSEIASKGMRAKASNSTIDNYSYGILVWQIAKDGEEPFSDMEDDDEMDQLKHEDKELDYLMRQLDDEDMPEEFKIVFMRTTCYFPEDRISLADVRGLMKIDDDQLTEAKAAFEANAKEHPSFSISSSTPSALFTLYLDVGTLKLMKIIGHGAYGRVYSGYLNEKPVAIKRITVMDSNIKEEEVIKSAKKELNLLKRLHEKSNFIIQFICQHIQDSTYHLVMELAGNGDLQKYLFNKKLENDWLKKIQICVGISEGLDAVHSCEVTHRDMKAANIFLDESLNPKIGDFGISKTVASIAPAVTCNPLTTRWVAPERVMNSNLSYEQLILADVYGYGMVMWEVLMDGKMPYENLDEMGVNLLKMKHSILEVEDDKSSLEELGGSLPDDLPDVFRNLVLTFRDLTRQCLSLNPIARPTLITVREGLEKAQEEYQQITA